jgi:hypothetical protein
VTYVRCFSLRKQSHLLLPPAPQKRSKIGRGVKRISFIKILFLISYINNIFSFNTYFNKMHALSAMELVRFPFKARHGEQRRQQRGILRAAVKYVEKSVDIPTLAQELLVGSMHIWMLCTSQTRAGLSRPLPLPIDIVPISDTMECQVEEAKRPIAEDPNIITSHTVSSRGPKHIYKKIKHERSLHTLPCCVVRSLAACP